MALEGVLPHVSAMTTLTDIRTRLRTELQDPGADRWSDAELDWHITHALGELTLAIPLEARATIATAAGSRDIDLSVLAGLIAVEAVEYPLGEFPPQYTGYGTWGSTLTLQTPAAPDGGDAGIFYSARHVLDDDGSTLPPHLEDVLILGAAASAGLGRASGTVESLNLNSRTTEEHLALARARQTAFQQLLRVYGRGGRMTARRLYAPA